MDISSMVDYCLLSFTCGIEHSLFSVLRDEALQSLPCELYRPVIDVLGQREAQLTQCHFRSLIHIPIHIFGL